MISFLSPWWMLALAAIPMIRWLHTHQAPLSTHHVSALFLWRADGVDSQAGPQRRPPDPAWRRRALIAALVVLSLASPVLSFAPATVTVWWDKSPSMQSLEAGDSRQALAERALDEALTAERLREARRIELAPPLPQATSASDTNWLVSDGANDEIRAWAKRQPFDRVIQVGATTRNAGVAGVAIRRTATGAIDSLVSVHNAGESVEHRQLTIRIGDEPIHQLDVSIQAGETLHLLRQLTFTPESVAVELDPGDALSIDDSMSLSAQALRQHTFSADAKCPAPLMHALRTHPGLTDAPIGATADLTVSCGETAPLSAARGPRESAHIHAYTGASRPTQSVPTWFNHSGDRRIETGMSIESGLLRTTAWPDGQAFEHILLLAGSDVLALITHTGDARRTSVHTVIDFSDPQFAKQPAYPAVLGELIDAAFGMSMLEPITSNTRPIELINIRPKAIVTAARSAVAPANDSMALQSLLILLACIVLTVDIAFLVRARNEAANA